MRKTILAAALWLAAGSLADAAQAARGGASRCGSVSAQWLAALRNHPDTMFVARRNPLSAAPLVAALERQGLSAGSFSAADFDRRRLAVGEAWRQASLGVRGHARQASLAVKEIAQRWNTAGRFDAKMHQELWATYSDTKSIRDYFEMYLKPEELYQVNLAHGNAQDLLSAYHLEHGRRIAEKLGTTPAPEALPAAGSPGTAAQGRKASPLAPAARKAAPPASKRVPPASKAPKTEKGPSGRQTLSDGILIAGAAAAGYLIFDVNPVIAAYASTVFVSTVRYSSDIAKGTNRKGWGGAAKLGAAVLMVATLAPMALAVDIINSLMGNLKNRRARRGENAGKGEAK